MALSVVREYIFLSCPSSELKCAARLLHTHEPSLLLPLWVRVHNARGLYRERTVDRAIVARPTVRPLAFAGSTSPFLRGLVAMTRDVMRSERSKISRAITNPDS